MIQIDTIQRYVAASFDMAIIDMTSDRRSKRQSHPRQVAMYLSRYLTNMSLPAIGRYFGDRDHTTVMHAIRAVEGRMLRDPQLSLAIRTMQTVLQGEPEHV